MSLIAKFCFVLLIIYSADCTAVKSIIVPDSKLNSIKTNEMKPKKTDLKVQKTPGLKPMATKETGSVVSNEKKLNTSQYDLAIFKSSKAGNEASNNATWGLSDLFNITGIFDSGNRLLNRYELPLNLMWLTAALMRFMRYGLVPTLFLTLFEGAAVFYHQEYLNPKQDME